ncbi:sensor histidine kinase [Stenotrophomonas sp. PS02300]|uniref:sensor histidine kinase n=1 Tax=Stenotrophomonas sp. PS02300 TaxID=2991426 RepID=UPI00249C610C|nr:sensor histidine kinase [Stenotrophomonas sp. PS02300]
MLAQLNHNAMLRYSGLFTWGTVGLWLAIYLIDPVSLTLENLDQSIIPWASAYLTFGGVYWVLTRDLGESRPGIFDHAALVLLTACAIGVSYFSGTALGSILLMVVAGLLPWLLGPRVGLLWLVASNLAVLPVYIKPLGFPPLIGLLQAMGYMGFSSFVFVIALVARRQAEARDEQRRLNAELRATRALLAESARVNERTRISRELHDLLGHQLTALALNLEVAGHLAEGRALEHVKRSHALAKLLLGNVREVVSQLRETGAIDLAAALRPLTENVPSLDIHLEIEEPLSVEDPQRAHVLLRCTQEIITNTVRHAAARHLWIRVWREDPNVLVVEARDDGVGAEAVNVGNGLRGMRERLEQCGGTLQIDSRRGEGFCLRASVPGAPELQLASVC